jgi:ABC-type cobalamin transport system ATPase subunit
MPPRVRPRCSRVSPASALPGSLLRRMAGLRKVEGSVDQSHVRKGLGELAGHALAIHIEFLRQQPDIVGQAR